LIDVPICGILTKHFHYTPCGPGVGGAQACGVPAVGRARCPGRVALGFVQLEADKYVQDDDERPRSQEEQYRRQFERVRQLVGQPTRGQLWYDRAVLFASVHESHLYGLHKPIRHVVITVYEKQCTEV